MGDIDSFGAVALVMFGFGLGLAFTLIAVDHTAGEQDMGDPTLMFRSDGIYQRSIGVYFPESNSSIVCEVNRKDEIQVSDFTYKYVNSTECNRVSKDIEAVWDDPGFKNIDLYEELLNATNSTR